MHYAFDAEFELRAALAGEIPLILQDRVMAAQAYHADQKSSNMPALASGGAPVRRAPGGRPDAAERRRLRLVRPAVWLWRRFATTSVQPGSGSGAG